jgi:hypothetical protein
MFRLGEIARRGPGRNCRRRRVLPGRGSGGARRRGAKRLICLINSFGTRIAMVVSRGGPAGHACGRQERSWRSRHGYLRCSHDRRRGLAGAIVRAAEHFRQYREFADDRLQGNRHELRCRRGGGLRGPAAFRQRAGGIRRHQHGSRLDPVLVRGHQPRHQRQRIVRGGETGVLLGQSARVQRHHRLHAPGRFSGKRGRLSGQRRRLLPDGPAGERHQRKSDRQRPAGSPIQQ